MENQTQQPISTNSANSTDSFIVHPSQFKIILTMVLVGITCWSSFTSLFDGDTPFLLKPIILATTGLSGYVLYFLVQKYFKKIPSLIIDEKGIYDDVLPVSIDQITWDEIDFVEVYKMETEIPFFTQEYLGIVVKDPAVFQQKLGFLQQKIFKINHWFPKFKGQINIPIYMIDTNGDTVLRHIKKFHPEKIQESTQ